MKQIPKGSCLNVRASKQPFVMPAHYDCQIAMRFELIPPIMTSENLELGAPGKLPIYLSDDIQLEYKIGPGKAKPKIKGSVQYNDLSVLTPWLINIQTNQALSGELDENGYYEFDVEKGTHVFIVVMQKVGKVWRANQNYQVGDLIQPTAFNHRQYKITVAGNSGSVEPSWWLEVHQELGMIGSAQGRVIPYVQPKVHGPIIIQEQEGE